MQPLGWECVDVFIDHGSLRVCALTATAIAGSPPTSWNFFWSASVGSLGWQWTPGWGSNRFGDKFLDLPIWMLAPLSLAGFAALVWLDRRAARIEAAGHCRSCGYDLTGVTASVCPECGTAAR